MSTLGPRTALKSRKISGSLAYILAQTNVKQGTKAATNDVAGCTLEMSASGWVGCLGVFASDAAMATATGRNYATLASGAFYKKPGSADLVWGGLFWKQVPSAYALLAGIKVGKAITANIVGDSLSNNYDDQALSNSSWWQNLEQISRGLITFVHKCVVSGSNIDHHLSGGITSGGFTVPAFDTDTALYPADICIIELLTNNLNIYTANVCAAKMLLLCNKARAAGQEPVVIGIGPISTYTTRTLASYFINRAVKAMCQANGILWYNPMEAIRDPSTFGYQAAYKQDDYHFSRPGSYPIATELFNQMFKNSSFQPYAPGRNPTSFLAVPASCYPIRNAALVDSTSTGLATGWTTGNAGSQVFTNTAQANGKRRQTITGVPGASFVGMSQLTSGIQSEFLPGDILDVYLDFSASLVGTGAVDISSRWYSSPEVSTRCSINIPEAPYSGRFHGQITIPETLDTTYGGGFELRIIPGSTAFSTLVIDIDNLFVVNQRLEALALNTYIGAN